MLAVQRATLQFQSAPLTEARGDPRTMAGEIAPDQVSIRSPHRSKGRRRIPPRSTSPTRVSIRSPHRSKGRRHRAVPSLQGPRVSIRSPHRSKGRRPYHRGAGRRREFQSAPLTEARGDTCWHPRSSSEYVGFNPLPSPKQGETSVSMSYFDNPLPSPKQGETPLGDGLAQTG